MTISKQIGNYHESDRQRYKLRGLWESAEIWGIRSLGGRTGAWSRGTGLAKVKAGSAACRATLAIGITGLLLFPLASTGIQPAAAMAGLDSSDRAAVLSADK